MKIQTLLLFIMSLSGQFSLFSQGYYTKVHDPGQYCKITIAKIQQDTIYATRQNHSCNLRVDSIIDGYWIIMSNGKMAETIVYKDNMKNGAHITYDTNGVAWYISNYTHDTLDGLNCMYDTSGRIMFSQNYTMGVLHGTYENYDFCGKRTLASYDMGELSGIITTYWSNGMLCETRKYRKGTTRWVKYYNTEGKRISKKRWDKICREVCTDYYKIDY